MEQAVQAARKVHALDRVECRRRFEQHFTAERMARRYLAVFETVAEHRGVSLHEEDDG